MEGGNTMAERTEAERLAIEVVATISTLVSALQMIEQGYIFRGSEKVTLDAEGMRVIAREALIAKNQTRQEG
jgi:hypothetical protein